MSSMYTYALRVLELQKWRSDLTSSEIPPETIREPLKKFDLHVNIRWVSDPTGANLYTRP